MATPPPSGMKLSCIPFTPPSEAPVVAAAQTAVEGAPKRTSFPSMLTLVSTCAAACAGGTRVSVA